MQCMGVDHAGLLRPGFTPTLEGAPKKAGLGDTNPLESKY